MRDQFVLSIQQMSLYQVERAIEPDHAQEACNDTRDRQQDLHLEGQWNGKRNPLPEDDCQALQK